MIDFIKRNEWAILILVGGVVLNGVIFYLNSIHASKGEAEKHHMRYEIRKLEAYEMSDPNSKYSPARKMLIQELKSDLEAMDE